MSNDTPFTTHGDEPVEARMVSWVLGEASAFEAAELTRLCEKQPELMVFKRRMIALHGMLRESEQTGQDASWKLPQGKRDVIEELIGKETAASTLVEREKRIRKSQRRAFLAIAACVVLTLVVLNMFVIVPIRKEVPVIVSYMASNEEGFELQSDHYSVDEAPMAPASKERGSRIAKPTAPGRMVPLNSITDGKLPAELLEGTPRPIQLTDATGEKSNAYYGRSGKGAAMSRELSNQPSPPSSSVSKVLTDGLALAESNTVVPVPEGLKNQPSVKFGESADFGDGWGNAAQAGGKRAHKAKKEAKSSNLKLRAERELDRLGSSGGRGGADADPFGAPSDMNQDSTADAFAGSGPMDVQSRFRNNQNSRDHVEVETKFTEVNQNSKDELRFDGFLDAQYKVDAEGAELSVREKLLRDADDFNGQVPMNGDLPLLGKLFDSSIKGDLSNVQLSLKQVKELEESMDVEDVQHVKPANFAQLDDEIQASEDPFSTFSLNVSDASFQIAQAAMARGEQPDPDGIKVEQFYNAVDYGDPAPSAGQPVAGSIEQVAHPVIPGRNLVRVALKTAAAGRSASQPLRLTLLVDQSGSMVREDRREAMDEALTGLSKLLTANDKVTVIGFSRRSHLLADGLSGEQAGQLKGLIHQDASEGGTNLEEAIKLGEQLAMRHKLAGAQNRIVLFTDGAANLGDANPEHLADRVTALRQQGVAFDIAGIAADELNDDLLADLARNGNGRYYVVGKGANGDFAKKLAGAFRPAAENVKVQVRFNSERVARYKLVGFEKDRLKTEDFRNDAVDAAEMAAEEAGVAIYQVETIPDGRGEIGEVSVRFRDAESRDMVERSWTLPYDAGAPAIDRASPSMQLSTLAMLLGQKLKGGEIADAIDFTQLTTSQAEVKQAYGSDSRVMDLLQMIDQLK